MPTAYFEDESLIRRHYCVAALLFMFYGVQVCPFIASLSTAQYLAEVSALFLGMYFLRRKLTKRFQLQSIEHHVASEFKTGLGIFALGAVILGAGNTLFFDFPLESGLKVSVGLLSLGFFIATHSALHRERALAKWCASTGVELSQEQQAFPLTQKFSLFASALIIWSLAIMFLIIVKDLDWLLSAGQQIDSRKAQMLILAEVLYVGIALLAYALLIVRGYASNISLFLDNENNTLQSVQQGQRNKLVPVGSSDEFGRMARYTNHMIASLRESELEVQRTRDVTILALASLAETRDNETGAHIIRTQFYVKALALELRNSEQYRPQLDDETVDLLFKSAPLHDVGKVGIPDAVLLKPGKLTDEEFDVIKQHPMIGSEALARAEERLGSTSFLRYAREISETHHEKWDGSGYPAGLQGQDIPLSGRLMALADVYDALISKRVYKPAFPHEKAKAIILEGKGSHFDPAVVEAFVRCEAEFKAIAAQYQDSATPVAA